MGKRQWRLATIVPAVLLAGALAGCVGRGAAGGDSTQSFLGISQDIRAVFSTGSSYNTLPSASYLAE